MSGQNLTQRSIAQSRLVAGTRSRRVTPPAPAAAAGDDMTFIESIALDSVQTFSAISGSYRHLLVLWTARSTTTGLKSVLITFNGDSGNNYDYTGNLTTVDNTAFESNGVANIRVGVIPPSDASAGIFGSGKILLNYYSTTVNSKGTISECSCQQTTAIMFREDGAGMWRTSNAAVTSITFAASAGAFAANSVASLYGIT